MFSTAFICDDAEPAPAFSGRFFAAEPFIRGEHPLPAPGVSLINACQQRDYLSPAYYVSLMAEARGHSVFPHASDILAALHIVPSGLQDRARRTTERRIAVLLTPSEPFAASSLACMLDFARCAERQGIRVDIIDKHQIAALDQADALFIRDLTTPTNHTYAFALRAKALGIPVIDDPTSIMFCSNKIFVHERLRCLGVPTPRTFVMTPGMDIHDAIAAFGLPLVLKIPNGSFSLGVNKISTAAQGASVLEEMRGQTAYLLAQEYMPTSFDWRIGILDGKPLYACQYHMVRGHWQVIQHRTGADPLEGHATAVPLAQVPWGAVDVAQRAARATGDGLYGVDIKESGGAFHVIEVNANPDVYSDFEAGAEVDCVWERLVAFFAQRMRAGELPQSEVYDLPAVRVAGRAG